MCVSCGCTRIGCRVPDPTRCCSTSARAGQSCGDRPEPNLVDAEASHSQVPLPVPVQSSSVVCVVWSSRRSCLVLSSVQTCVLLESGSGSGSPQVSLVCVCFWSWLDSFIQLPLCSARAPLDWIFCLCARSLPSGSIVSPCFAQSHSKVILML